ncbi:Protein disulfide isomerase [Carpediemonas membranifera]|uniref:Protein disulfide isomerase n=1 Tax=Carpediemonas membranifera TaxID=201153 RepID=A0A8J6B1F0_9EUKA|nr:Protein disulfide isomerase [Carpediemonas membranifera]|eukprot:KAG9390977.1 Protein disulfide isomerase [Carpediemonas membranifera]
MIKALILCVLIATVFSLDYVSFEEMKDLRDNLIVAFADSDTHADTMDILKNLEGQELFEGFRFICVDKQLDENKEVFSQGFDDSLLPLLFIVTPEEGVDRVGGTTEEALTQAMTYKRMEGNDELVLTLTSKAEIEELYTRSLPVMIKCFEQWCGHCKALAPVYAKAATIYEDRAILAEIECSLNEETQEFCASAGVKGFPTVFGLHDGQLLQYNMPRTVPALSLFIDTLTSEPELIVQQEMMHKAEEARQAETERDVHERIAEAEARVAELEAENADLQTKVDKKQVVDDSKDEL